VKLHSRCSIIDFFTKICQNSEYAYILESIEGPEKLAECSFMGFNPKIVVTVKDGKVEIRNRVDGERLKLSVDDPLHVIKGFVGNARASPSARALLEDNPLSYGLNCWAASFPNNRGYFSKRNRHGDQTANS